MDNIKSLAELKKELQLLKREVTDLELIIAQKEQNEKEHPLPQGITLGPIFTEEKVKLTS